MYPYQRTPMGNPYISPISRGYLWVSYPQESLENTINTMGTLLGVHPIVPWVKDLHKLSYIIPRPQLFRHFGWEIPLHQTSLWAMWNKPLPDIPLVGSSWLVQVLGSVIFHGLWNNPLNNWLVFHPLQGGPPTSYKYGYNSTYRGYNPSYPIIRRFIRVITPFITSRGPPCICSANNQGFFRHCSFRDLPRKSPKNIDTDHFPRTFTGHGPWLQTPPSNVNLVKFVWERGMDIEIPDVNHVIGIFTY